MGNFKASSDDASDTIGRTFFEAENLRRKSSFYLYIFLVWFIGRPNKHTHTSHYVICGAHVNEANVQGNPFVFASYLARARIIELLTHYGFLV